MGLLETLTSASSHASEARTWLMCERAAAYLEGAVEADEDEQGWVRPHRLFLRQRQALASCLAWHPGLFRQMASTTAGVCLRFRTDACEVALAVKLDCEPMGTRAVLAPIDRSSGRGPRPHDGVGVVVDGKSLPCALPEVISRPLPWIEDSAGMGIVTFALGQDDSIDGVETMVLPGFGVTHVVEIWLPCLRGCVIRELWLDGTFVEPLERRERMLVLSDSIGQGFCAENPALTWPAVLARELDLELVNQSIGGQVFQPTMLEGPLIEDVRLVVVALGGNYRWESCPLFEAERDGRAFVAGVIRRYRDARIACVSPLWHDEHASPSREASPWREFSWKRLFKSGFEASKRQVPDESRRFIIDGTLLLGQERDLFADAEHPNAEGHALIARRISLVLSGHEDEGVMRMRALAELDLGPLRARPVAEAIRAGRARVTYAEQGCVFAHAAGGADLVYAPDHERALDAATLHLAGDVCFLFEPGLEKELGKALGFARMDRTHVCVYEGDEPIGVDEELASRIRVLDEGFADTILKYYAHPEFVSRPHLLSMLAQGRFLGLFEADKLRGFVGEHPEGSIGLLQMMRGQRRKGYGFALEATKINECLKEGRLPWTEVYPKNKASVALQRKLGMTVLPATDQCYLYR